MLRHILMARTPILHLKVIPEETFNIITKTLIEALLPKLESHFKRSFPLKTREISCE